jgi:hypothetical protein
MKYISLLLLYPLLVAASADSVVDQLPQAKLQEIFQRLQSASLDSAKLTDEELNRAAVQGLLERMGSGFQIVEKGSGFQGKLVSELLRPEVAYLRPGSLSAEELPALDHALEALDKSSATMLILDFRSPAAPGTAELAAQWLSRFIPTGNPLFTVRTSGTATPQAYTATGKPLWMKPVLGLIDAETNNTAEAVAAVLQRQRQMFLVGTSTLGQPIEYRTHPLTDTLEMRWAASELMLDEKTSLFHHGLKPTLETRFDPTIKLQQFTASEATGMKRLAFEIERPRLNEAALVARTNPELNHRIAQSANQTTPFDLPSARDPVLQQALDFLTAQAFLRSSPTTELPAGSK